MGPLAHIVAGTLITGFAGTPAGYVLSAIAAFFVHWILDDMNVDYAGIYHGLGTGWWKPVYIILQVVCVGAVGVYIGIHNPWLAVGALCACLWDIDHLLHFLIPTHWPKHRLHRRQTMWPDWLRTEKALPIKIVASIVVVLILWL